MKSTEITEEEEVFNSSLTLASVVTYLEVYSFQLEHLPL